jgi:hypothetical protein
MPVLKEASLSDERSPVRADHLDEISCLFFRDACLFHQPSNQEISRLLLVVSAVATHPKLPYSPREPAAPEKISPEIKSTHPTNEIAPEPVEAYCREVIRPLGIRTLESQLRCFRHFVEKAR